ncbi:glutamate-cysteine ligase family protein [Kitasatospora sp. RB6PN24]|uniref:glutamate-cysteine ligase family protein n=1 Tax=Kitasatospora humi TaxID=2893891 RepID=UPI001E2A4DEC|nr:glutamate-cysteine ligase family protein [Kitasatospora humi]MCC9312271.1 glutamate-cysteine ligase family protein [Kitasatospora humi]
MVAQLRRVGLELEFPVVELGTGRGLDRAGAQRLWHALVRRDPSWRLVQESITGAVTGVRRARDGFDERLNTDTGVCTVELSLAPQRTVGLAVDAAHEVLRTLQELLEPMGCTVLCAGIQPRTWADPARKSQKDWYLLLVRRWHLHHWMVPLASHQASVDVTPDEAARAVNVLSGFAGVFTALTACSPVARGREQEWKEMRNWVWHERSTRVPPAEAAYTSNSMPAQPFADMGAYLDHHWASRVWFLTNLKSGGCEVLGGRSFKDFLLARDPVPARRIDGTPMLAAPDREVLDRIHQYGWPAAKLHYSFDSRADLDGVRRAIDRGRLGDWFEEHAVNCYVENRSCGVAPQGEEGVAAALTLGIVERLDDAEALLKEWAWPQWRELWLRASIHGLAAEDDRSISAIRALLEVAARGLRSRGAGEDAYLAPLFARLEQRETPADRMITAFRAGGLRQLLADFGRAP